MIMMMMIQLTKCLTV